MELQPIYIQILALVLFTIGLITALARRNVFFVLMGVELALNAVNLSFVGFAKTLPAELSVAGQIVPLFSRRCRCRSLRGPCTRDPHFPQPRKCRFRQLF